MFTTAALLLLAPAQPPKKEPPPKFVVSAEEAKKLAGTWVVQSVRSDGKAVDPGEWKGGEVTFTEKGFEATKPIALWTFAKGYFKELDASGKGLPRMAVQTVREVKDGKESLSDYPYLWSYQLKGDTLTLAQSYMQNAEYAKDFDKGAFYLITLKKSDAKK